MRECKRLIRQTAEGVLLPFTGQPWEPTDQRTDFPTSAIPSGPTPPPGSTGSAPLDEDSGHSPFFMKWVSRKARGYGLETIIGIHFDHGRGCRLPVLEIVRELLLLHLSRAVRVPCRRRREEAFPDSRWNLPRSPEASSRRPLHSEARVPVGDDVRRTPVTPFSMRRRTQA